MSQLNRDNWLSEAISPALRNDPANSYGLIKPFPVLGDDFKIELTAWAYDGQPEAYLLCVTNDDPNDLGVNGQGSHIGFINNFVVGRQEYYSLRRTNTPTPGATTNWRMSFPVGTKSQTNTLAVESIPDVGTKVVSNGVAGTTSPTVENVTWVQGGLTLGAFGRYTNKDNPAPAPRYYNRGRYDNLKVWISGALVIDIDFEDGVGQNKVSPGTYDMQLVSGATIVPDPRPAAPTGALYDPGSGTTTFTPAPGKSIADYEMAFQEDEA